MSEDPAPFVPRALTLLVMVTVLGVAVWIVAAAGNVVLITLAAVLLGVALSAPTDWMCRRFGFRRAVAVGIVLTVAFSLLVGAVALFGTVLATQGGALAERLPGLLAEVEGLAGRLPLLGPLVESSGGLEAMVPTGPEAAAKVAEVLGGALQGLGGILAFLFIGAFLAVDPGVYRRGLLRLLPMPRRPRADRVMTQSGLELRHWLVGTGIAMVVDGVATGLGLWAIGIDQALLLGVLAGTLAFIPNIGAFLAVAPAIAIAIPEGAVKVGLVVALFLVVQTLEGNVLTPLLHASAGDIPPALQLATQLLFATVAGTLGLALATPILIVLVVAVRAFYVEDILGDVAGDASCPG